MNADKNIAANSATGFASHTPFTPKRAGSTSMAIIINTKEREKASTAEINPLDKAVNIPLANTLNPIKISEAEHIRFPVTAKSYTSFPGREKTDTKGLVRITERTVAVTATIPIIFKLKRISFFNFILFCSP